MQDSERFDVAYLPMLQSAHSPVLAYLPQGHATQDAPFSRMKPASQDVGIGVGSGVVGTGVGAQVWAEGKLSPGEGRREPKGCEGYQNKGVDK